MAALPEAITNLIAALGKLPGIGPRSAERLALYLVQSESAAVREELAKYLGSQREQSPNTLIRLGVTKYTVKVGTELTIDAYQAKEGTNKAVGRNFVLPDGTRLFLSLNGAVPGTPAGPPDK